VWSTRILTTTRGSVRREIQIRRPAGEVWELVGDPARIHEWFPGIVSCSVSGDERVITTDAGQSITEKVVTLDPLQRRFQYAMDWPICREHLGTVDVLELNERSCLVVYGTDAEPATMALTIGGAAGAALGQLRDLLEAWG
jgi:uncharacterized protein YndB with AHSA1/START domain